LEEYGPKIVYIKGIYNTVADAISRLEYDPSVNRTAKNYHLTKVKRRNSKRSQRQSWMTVSKHWCNLGNTILVKLELWELVIVFNNNFYSATNVCLRYASAKCGR
jgi:hypothetical protein